MTIVQLRIAITELPMPTIHFIRKSSAPEVTIAFIHGSHGHYLKNWGPMEDGENWVHWLGHDVKTADIISIEHEASFRSLSDLGTFDDYAKTIGNGLAQAIRSERIVFVCYSLGGIIIKRLIKLVADGRSDLLPLRNMRCDFCFIATPHLGANFKRIEPIVRVVPNPILKTIFGFNPEIDQINKDFTGISRPLVESIACFGERKRHRGLFTIVHGSSSFIEDERALNLAISKTHSEICVAKTRGDIIYMTVAKLAANCAPKAYIGEASFTIDSNVLDRLFDA